MHGNGKFRCFTKKKRVLALVPKFGTMFFGDPGRVVADDEPMPKELRGIGGMRVTVGFQYKLVDKCSDCGHTTYIL